MGQHSRRESDPGPLSSSSSTKRYQCRHHDLFDKENDLVWPFGKLEGLDEDDIRQAAYEIFFTSCRSSPGFGGKNAITFYSSHEHNNNNNNGEAVTTTMTPLTVSKVKRALGLKMLKRTPSSKRMMTMMSCGGLPSPTSPLGKPGQSTTHAGGSPSTSSMPPIRPRRPMTSAEIMRQQMRVSEQSDSRLRKTLMRTLVGQVTN